MASFGDLPTEIAQKCVEFLEFGHLKGSVTEVKSVSRGLRRAARWALTRGRWRPIRFVSEHGLDTLKKLRGGLNSLDDGVAATFRAAWALDPGLVMRVIREDMVDDYHGDAYQAVFLNIVRPSRGEGSSVSSPPAKACTAKLAVSVMTMVGYYSLLTDC